VIAFSFLAEIIMAKPVLSEVAAGFVPSVLTDEALYIAIGIIGATVMPHNLYLHSALVQTRKIDRSDAGIKQAIKYNRIDTTVALNIAFLVNAAILILAATVFFKTGNSHVGEIKEAHRLLPGFLGNAAPILFALALIAAGQSSTVTGTLAGQIVMEGYLSLRLNPILRRLLTRMVAIIPAVVVIGIYGENKIDALLIGSQVILSLQLGYAVIPLIQFVSDKKTMGKFAIKPITKIAAWLIATVLVFLNLKMLFNEVVPIFEGQAIWPKILVVTAVLIFGSLLLYIILHPFIRKAPPQKSILMHAPGMAIGQIEKPSFYRIAIALDFSANDAKIISHALAQGNATTRYLLLHIVESAGAKLLGAQTDDYETRKDMEKLAAYAEELRSLGYDVATDLGFRNRVKEIVRIVNSGEADLLVIGGHGHTGIKDFIYGATVDAVRHELKIPVFIVNL
ncbi:MAG: iron/manganese transporter, partial [Chitinophagaceae bacterium]